MQQPRLFFVKKTRKGKTKEIDIRPLIEKLTFTGPQQVELEIIAESAQPGIKPIEAIVSILGISEKDTNHIEIVKKGWEQLD